MDAGRGVAAGSREQRDNPAVPVVLLAVLLASATAVPLTWRRWSRCSTQGLPPGQPAFNQRRMCGLPPGRRGSATAPASAAHYPHLPVSTQF